MSISWSKIPPKHERDVLVYWEYRGETGFAIDHYCLTEKIWFSVSGVLRWELLTPPKINKQ